MNMLDGLSDLGGNALAKVLRRTIVSAVIVGAAAVVIALLLSAPWAALGLALGLAMAVLNLRFLDAGVAKLHTDGEINNKVLRRAMGTKSVTRLGIITLICVGLLLARRPPRHRGGGRARHLPVALRRQRGPRHHLAGDPMSGKTLRAGQWQHHHRRPPRRGARGGPHHRPRRRLDHVDRRCHRHGLGAAHAGQGHLGRPGEAPALLGDDGRAGLRPGAVGHRSRGRPLRRSGRHHLLLHPDLQLAGLHPERGPRLPGPADRRREPAAGAGAHRVLPGALQLDQGTRARRATSSTTRSPTPRSRRSTSSRRSPSRSR